MRRSLVERRRRQLDGFDKIAGALSFTFLFAPLADPRDPCISNGTLYHRKQPTGRVYLREPMTKQGSGSPPSVAERMPSRMFALSKASDLSLEFAPTTARRSPGDLRAEKIRGNLACFDNPGPHEQF